MYQEYQELYFSFPLVLLQVKAVGQPTQIGVVGYAMFPLVLLQVKAVGSCLLEEKKVYNQEEVIVSISSPSGEGGGQKYSSRKGETYYLAFPLVLLQVKAVGFFNITRLRSFKKFPLVLLQVKAVGGINAQSLCIKPCSRFH